MKLSSFFSIPKKLRRLLTRKQKIYLLILLIFTIFVSVLETLGISVLMPFITVAANPAILDEGNYKTVFDFLGFTEKNKFIITFGVVIIAFYFFRMILNITFTYIINKFSLGLIRNFSLNLFKTYISIPYKNFVQNNTGDIIHKIGGESGRVGQLVLGFMTMFSELFTILMIYGFLIVVNWRMTLVLTLILSVIIYLVITILLKQSRKQGIITSEAGAKSYKILQKTFGNIKFIKLRGKENEYLDSYNSSVRSIARANIVSTTLGVLPRNILENIGFSILIGVVIFIIIKMNSPELIIPIISMYALAFYRMLPGVNRMLGNLNAIAFNQNALDIVYDAVNLETETEGNAQISFNNSIKIDTVTFKYNTGNEVLRDINLIINKGESVAIVGESGTGKSTLVDILIGIHKPNSGIIYIDDVKITNENIRSWRDKIGYIPQNIYLFDGTVAENVAFSSELDETRLIKSLKMANIWNFLEEKNGINTLVGEGGIQLSGGQKQRVGIARALYNNPDVLVLDEATSSLDNETEEKIMNEIYSLSKDKTLIIIAHRLSTVERCKRKIVIEDGRIVKE